MDKKKFIKDLLPDLLELIDRKLNDETEKEKPKTTTRKKAVKKKAATKRAVKRRTTTRKKKVSKTPTKKRSQNVTNKFVDDLTEATEFLELDKLVCGRGPREPRIKNDLITKTCGMIADENGQKIQVGGCGKKFESTGGYLCDKCLEGRKNA